MSIDRSAKKHKSKILDEDVQIEHKSKNSSTELIIRNNIAINIFRITAEARAVLIPGGVLPLQISVSLNDLVNGLDKFALAIANPCCTKIPKDWLCFLVCLLSAINRASSTSGSMRPIFLELANVISLLFPFATDKCDGCSEICTAIISILAAIIETLGGLFSIVGGAIGFDTVTGTGFNTLNTTLGNLARAIQCSFSKCQFLPCELIELLTQINILITTFISNTPGVSPIFSPISGLLTSITADCLRNITSRGTKLDKELKQAICNAQVSVEALAALASTPITTLTAIITPAF